MYCRVLFLKIFYFYFYFANNTATTVTHGGAVKNSSVDGRGHQLSSSLVISLLECLFLSIKQGGGDIVHNVVRNKCDALLEHLTHCRHVTGAWHVYISFLHLWPVTRILSEEQLGMQGRRKLGRALATLHSL